MDYTPILKYYRELEKNFSTSYIKNNNFPFKIIILFPWDKEHWEEIKQLNDYFLRNTNIVSVPLMVWNKEHLDKNLEYLESYIKNFIKENQFRKEFWQNFWQKKIKK